MTTPAPAGWASVTVGYDHTCAIRTNRALWCWGLNDSGQLGLGYYTVGPGVGTPQPQQVTSPAAAGWATITAGFAHTCAIRSGGRLWCWGWNDRGQLGIGSRTYETDLARPVADTMLPRLPPPLAGAMRAALGLAAADVPVTATLLERATVGLLSTLAGAGVVVAIDDEQWVDQDSLRLLGSAVVRLKDVPVRWLVAVRSGHTGRGLAQMLDHELGAAVARVDLAGLDDEALSQLILDRSPGRWSPGVLRRVVELAAGSPYAALELARETAALGGRDGTAVHHWNGKSWN